MEAEYHACPYCSRCLKHLHSLHRHVKVVHQDVRPFVCECKRRFATREQLTRHRSSKHSAEKLYPCERGCNKSFASYSARVYHHQAVHDAIKYLCPIIGCGKRFTSKIYLKNHLLKPHYSGVPTLPVFNWFASYSW